LRAEIALARIRQDGEHAFTVAELRGNQAACVKNRSRGDPAKNPLLLREPARSAARILVRNRDESIDCVSIENFGDEARADTLNLVRSGLAAREHRRIRRLDGKDSQRFDLLLQDLADAGSGAACSYSNNEGVQFVTADIE